MLASYLPSYLSLSSPFYSVLFSLTLASVEHHHVCPYPKYNVSN